MEIWTRLTRLPAHVVNGIVVAVGVALAHGLAALLGGDAAGLAATSGAIFASIGDAPAIPARNLNRICSAALLGLVTSALAALARDNAIALGIVVVLLSFAANMLLAWGPRAGPMSFVPMLALVFTMAAPPPTKK